MRSFGLFAAVLVCLCGCSKKDADAGASPEAPASPAAEAPARTGKELIPGENDVRAALKSKNYSQAVSGLMAMQGLLATTEQKAEWGNLYQEVRDALQDAPGDPKAVEALNTLRAMRQGR